MLYGTQTELRAELDRARIPYYAYTHRGLPDVVDTRRTLKGMHESGLLASPTAPLAFTPRGKGRARDLIRRRRLAEVLFSSALHLPEDEAEQTACLMEHVIDP